MHAGSRAAAVTVHPLLLRLACFASAGVGALLAQMTLKMLGVIV